MSRFYDENDSKEVRAAFYAAKKGKPDLRKTIVATKEFERLKKAGADMGKYETMDSFQSRIRKKQAEAYKENYSKGDE